MQVQAITKNVRIFWADMRTFLVMAWTCMGTYLASALAVCAPCFLNVRVRENSPSRCPTMFSVTDTGLKILPLWTLKVRPTKSGVIIERRDQDLIGVLDLASFALAIFSIRCPSTNGPFLIERPINQYCFIGRPSRRTRINRLENLRRRRVFFPFVMTPQGVTGWPPPEVLPAPPPIGWSTGFLATARLSGRMPRCRERPALPRTTFSCSGLPTWPMVA